MLTSNDLVPGVVLAAPCKIAVKTAKTFQLFSAPIESAEMMLMVQLGSTKMKAVRPSSIIGHTANDPQDDKQVENTPQHRHVQPPVGCSRRCGMAPALWS